MAFIQICRVTLGLEILADSTLLMPGGLLELGEHDDAGNYTELAARQVSAAMTPTDWRVPVYSVHILEEGLGIRLENDIVVTEDGFDDLMGDIPLDAEAIEDAMNS